jgi:aspartate/methionine/tyrosine aminotransferase
MRDINDYCIKRGIPSLAQGMIELPPPVTLRKIAGEVALLDNVHTYRNRFGEKDYLEAIQSVNLTEYKSKVGVENLMATQGVSGGIVSSLALTSDQGGRRVGLIEPFYTYHIFQIERVFGKSAEVVYLPLKGPHENYAPQWDLLEREIPQLSILIVCNPSNPTGKVWNAEEMRRLVALTKQHKCKLLLDECYSDMIWAPHEFFTPIQDGVEDHVIAVRGFSKVLGAQSWRAGYVVSSAATIQLLMRTADPIYICVPWLQHALGIFLSRHPEEFVKHKDEISKLMRENWRKLSCALKEALSWEPVEPGGTMYGVLLHTEGSDMEAVKRGLNAGVGVCPGNMFAAGTPAQTGWVRIHCGVSREKCQDIVNRLAQYKANKQ